MIPEDFPPTYHYQSINLGVIINHSLRSIVEQTRLAHPVSAWHTTLAQQHYIRRKVCES